MNNIEQLQQRARAAALHAHAPYSQFRVGAAVLCRDGTVVEGCNIENASFGLTICAERVALFSAVSKGLQPEALALSCIDADVEGPKALRMPCGACRQVMQELMPSHAKIYIDAVGCLSLEELLPQGFCLQRRPPKPQSQTDPETHQAK